MNQKDQYKQGIRRSISKASRSKISKQIEGQNDKNQNNIQQNKPKFVTHFQQMSITIKKQLAFLEEAKQNSDLKALGIKIFGTQQVQKPKHHEHWIHSHSSILLDYHNLNQISKSQVKKSLIRAKESKILSSQQSKDQRSTKLSSSFEDDTNFNSSDQQEYMINIYFTALSYFNVEEGLERLTQSMCQQIETLEVNQLIIKQDLQGVKLFLEIEQPRDQAILAQVCALIQDSSNDIKQIRLMSEGDNQFCETNVQYILAEQDPKNSSIMELETDQNSFPVSIIKLQGVQDQPKPIQKYNINRIVLTTVIIGVAGVSMCKNVSKLKQKQWVGVIPCAIYGISQLLIYNCPNKK